ncbi:MAG: lysylphosphatidylglycerol synthase domain-containing protein, partial [Gammaproteobacteria bacterium]
MSVVGTAALVAVVVALADVSALPVLVGRLEWPLALTALVLLQCEGLASALRLRLLVAGGTLRDSLAVTAWWVAGLAVLPARLGEITGMHALTRRCGVDAGVAVNSLLLQRLFDAAWLLVIGALALALHDGAGGGGVINVAAVLLAAALLIVACIGRMSLLFGIVAARLRRWRRTRFARGAL